MTQCLGNQVKRELFSRRVVTDSIESGFLITPNQPAGCQYLGQDHLATRRAKPKFDNRNPGQILATSGQWYQLGGAAFPGALVIGLGNVMAHNRRVRVDAVLKRSEERRVGKECRS